MPWSNQSGGGGPWGGGGNDNGPKGPWGQGPRGSGGGPNPPDLEDLLRKSQDRLKSVLPGGGLNGRMIALIGAALVVVWALTGWYRVQPDEIGVNLVFGKFSSLSNPGLNYNFPYPIGAVMKPRVTAVNSIDVGLRAAGNQTGTRSGGRDEPSESLMLTGDENIVDIDFSVQWQINPGQPQDFLFNIQDPEKTVRDVAESAMREVIGRRSIQPILTGDRLAIETEVADLMQRTLDSYKAGVIVRIVQLQKVDPPQQVIDAFRDVQAARADLERLQNEAQTYANRVIPEARGEASRITQAAEAYRDRAVAEARGAALRFEQVYAEYAKAPDVTRQRMYLETMERVLGGMDKIIIDEKSSGSGVVPFLPLNELQNRSNNQSATQGTGQ
ncbi:MAG: FtsH protease activity modulator HflK [Labrys sp. (in: a-proteobacteria)]|jgi:membrane protease subunit HflK